MTTKNKGPHKHKWGPWTLWRIPQTEAGDAVEAERLCRCGVFERKSRAACQRILNAKPTPKFRKVGMVETICDGSPEGLDSGTILYVRKSQGGKP